MSCIFTRPTLPHGKLPTTSWTYDGVGDYADWDDWTTADIVDADVLQRNWAILYSHVNGGLTCSDIDTGIASSVSESTALLDWDEDDTWPIWGHRHSHDGVDSSFLASDVVTHSILGTSAHYMLRHPSKARNAVFMFGRADPQSWGNRYSVCSIPLPFDHIKWGVSSVYREDGTNGNCHFLASSYKPNWSFYTFLEKRVFALPYLTVSTSSNAITEVTLSLYFQNVGGNDTFVKTPRDTIHQWSGVYTL